MKFILVASPRTGSTHLTTLLNSQDDIVCNGEIFHKHPTKVLVRWPKEDRTPEAIAELLHLRQNDPQAFLDRIFARSYGCRYVGFKIFSGHNDEALRQLIRDSSVKKLILFRRNVLAAYSSSRIAKTIGERVRKTPREFQPLVTFDPQKFRNYCKRYVGFYRQVMDQLNAERQTSHLIHYEQINDPWFFGALLNFIGAGCTKPTTLVGKSIKQNSSDIISRFSNPDDVLQFLGEHELMAWRYESEMSLSDFPPQAGGSQADLPGEEATN